jgi:NAD(P)-dependent dehydrogenase (short-subunit alcohol dehydrogenase family)
VQITALVGVPDSVVASLGRWHAVPSLLAAQTADLERVLQDYLIAHFVAARTFLPGLRAGGGMYVMINRPLAFEISPHAHSALVATATAAQHMLFRALAQELEGSPVRVVEIVNHAFLRDKQTQPGSPLPGEAVGASVAELLSDAAPAVHGRSIQLDSSKALSRARITIAPYNRGVGASAAGVRG